MSNGPIRILIADDQEMISTAFRFFLEAQPGIEVIAEATDGEQSVDLARRLRPDVRLLDIRMARLDSLEAIRLLAGPGVADLLRVVVTTFDLDEYVYTALRGGACGFLLKQSGPVLLAEAVRAAAAGAAMAWPSITVRLLQRLVAEPAKPTTGVGQAAAQLTEREVEVVRLIAHSRTNPETAAELHESVSTGKTRLSSVQLKLEVRNRVEIAAWAWQSGLANDTAAPH